MAPNLEDNSSLGTSSGPTIYLSPLIPYNNTNDVPGDPNDAESDADFLDADDGIIEEELIINVSRNLVPLEHDLRGLLMKVTGTEELERVTQVKLRVIARDVPLQHLNVHIPALRELILDGSVVSTLRDLGCGLKNLKILKVNRCGLAFLDGMFGFEGLEELYAADNSIENPIPCVFLANIRVIDLRRNRLKNVSHALPFLSLCEKLQHIHLEGNDEIWKFPKYRQTVKTLLPALRSLDGVNFTDVDRDKLSEATTSREFQQFVADTAEKNTSDAAARSTIGAIIHGTNSPRIARPSHSNTPRETSFTIRFPPTVFLDRKNN